jgi:N utilization substance protein A
MNLEVLHIIEQICREKGIAKNILIDALKSAIEAAAKKNLPEAKTIVSTIDENTGEIRIFIEKVVAEHPANPAEEIDLGAARKINPETQIGETVLIPQRMESYGRIAAQLAKQVILQKVREAEIELTYNEYISKKGEIISGTVQRFEHGDLIVDLGKAEGILPRREQVFRENFSRGERIRAFVVEVKKTPKAALVILSRTHTGLVKKLFEMEVPEISEGMVEIVGIAREPSGRTKITVRTHDRDIDAVGACVGMRGMRVQSIVQELRGEKIDIVQYSEDPQEFVRNALSPAKISRIIVDEKERQMTLIVADDQMSLAIGKKGQNVRLAAKLSKWKLDIKNESEAKTLITQPFLLRTTKTLESRVDFLDLVKTGKGLGDKIVSLLFAHNMVSSKEVIRRGLEGLTELPGVGPKKAEAILEVAQGHQEHEARLAEAEAAATAAASSAITTTVPPAAEETATSADSTEDTGKREPKAEIDAPIKNLQDVPRKTLSLLENNGFLTIAELSVTPLEELLAIPGLDEATAQNALQQAQSYMERVEA